VTYVEDRVNALINVWGKEEIERIEVQPKIEITEDEKLLRGPALVAKASHRMKSINFLIKNERVEWSEQHYSLFRFCWEDWR